MGNAAVAVQALDATFVEKQLQKCRDHIVEIISDSGEGAQKAGQAFGTISAKMGNGIWTVEIIPAEIEPPPRNSAGASGIRIRIGSFPITNAGDEADIIIAFNEQVLLGRLDAGNFKPGATILLESLWGHHADPAIVAAYSTTLARLVADGFDVVEVPMEQICHATLPNMRKGKNMFVLGLLCSIYTRDVQMARESIAYTFRKKGKQVIDDNVKLLEAGYNWAEENLAIKLEIPAAEATAPQIVVNGNEALALGAMASGMEVCAMYPITPATSASHFLSEIFESVGGLVHQAEDEIAAAGFAIGASYAGKCALTITSGPGMSLKTELLGLASMAEVPLVLINVQRGGPSTGLPTKVEQGDLLQALFGTHGDAPKVVMAPATIEDCFYSVLTARKIADTFRIPVVVLSDANLATGQQPFPRPVYSADWVAPPFDQSPVPDGALPFDWDEETGLSLRFIPGQPGGVYTLTGLAHGRDGKVAYEAGINQSGLRHRSLKLAALQKTLKPPTLFSGRRPEIQQPSGRRPEMQDGNEEGELLIVGWGSTKGAIEEAVERCRAEGLDVSALHLTFLQPMAPGIRGILNRFKKVVCVEMNYSDDPADEMIDEDNRRFSQLALLLRARYLVDVKSWSHVHGQPFKPGEIERMIREQLGTPPLNTN